MIRPTALILVVAASACVDPDAVEAELLIPDDLALHWDRSFNGEHDDRVALVPVDLMVYAAVTGEPIAGAHLVVEPGWPGVEVLPFDDIVPVDAEDCEETACVWDSWRDRYVEVLDMDTVKLLTDENGLVRAYLLVDAFPEPILGEFEAVTVSVVVDPRVESFQLVPQ